MTKDQLRHVYLVLFMFYDRDSGSVVPYLYEVVIPIYFDVYFCHRMVPLLVISSIYNDLVENLEQARYKCYIFIYHSLCA